MANFVPQERLPRFNITMSAQTWRRDISIIGSLLAIGILVTGRAMSGSLSSTVSQRPQVAGASVVEAATFTPDANQPIVTSTPLSIGNVSAQLQRQLDDSLQQSNLNYSLKIVSVSTGHVFGRNEHQIMVGASTTKLITAAATLSRVDAGTLSLNQRLDGTTLQEQMRLMINQSDNTAWDAINNLIGKPALQAYARQHGLTDFQVMGNQISAADLAQLLVQLGGGTLLSDNSTQLLLSWMKNTNEERLIPASLSGVDVYHKYGWIDGYVHDAAIIGPLNHATVVVLMTNSDNDTNLPDRAPVFGQVAQEVMAAVQQGW